LFIYVRRGNDFEDQYQKDVYFMKLLEDEQCIL